MSTSKPDCILVLTARGIGEILETKGSKAWRLSGTHASEYNYVVCVQNLRADWGTQEASHHHGFMVGRISSVTKIPNHPKKRWIINIDSYATIDIPNLWDGSRNPVAYRNMKDLGIDITSLHFQSIPEGVNSNQPSPAQETGDDYDVQPLTIQNAKEGLAMHFGVSVDDIQITING